MDTHVEKKKLHLSSHNEPSIDDVLHNVFKLPDFRPKQRKIIENILSGKDVIALLPTGSGKSLCYQLTSLMSNGITVVISPLLALINDQLSYLSKIGVCSYAFNSQVNSDEKRQIISDITSSKPKCKLLYTTPESVTKCGELNQALIQANKTHLLVRFIIDEAHCVSSWGHEFRESYLELKQIKRMFNGIQIVLFTATATPKVLMDMIIQLGMKKVHIHRQSFIRDNLSYSVIPKSSQVIYDMATMINHNYKGQSGIIYCLSRKNCETLAMKMTSLGISAEYFHAGLATDIKRDIQTRWINNQVQVIVATIAFGLGINKPDVRFVFHYTMPKSLEGYYQETGRAGRDGLPSNCILYYSMHDKIKLQYVIKKETTSPTTSLELLEYMDNYCNNKIDCRKRQLSIYLGEYIDYCCHDDLCDNCKNREHIIKTDLSKYQAIVDAIIQSCPRHQFNVLLGKLSNILPLSCGEIRRLINLLIVTQHLKHKTIVENDQITDYLEPVPDKPLTCLTLETSSEFNMDLYLKRNRGKLGPP